MEEPTKKRVILDTGILLLSILSLPFFYLSNFLLLLVDVGIDDAVAILQLLTAASKKEIEIEAILSVFGNVGAAQAAENVSKLCDLYDLTIPVYQVK